MKGQAGILSDTMALALAVWLCALPLVLIFVLPFFGLKVALGAAIGLLVLALFACWGICRWPKADKVTR